MPVSPTFPFHLRQALHGVDIAHFHHPFPLGRISYLWADSFAKMVVTWHGDIVRQRWSLRAYRPFLKRFLDKADRVVATSPEYLEHSSFLKRVRSKCEVIPLGVDPSRFTLTPDIAAAAETIRARYGQRLVLFVGRPAYYKGLFCLLQAMREVEGHCLINRQGPLRAELGKFAESSGIADRVTFISSCADVELPVYYYACDLLALPSVEVAEAFRLVQLEAMACGNPVISSDLPTGLRFVNLDGVTGLRVPPRDSAKLAQGIQRLLGDSKLRQTLGENARRRVHEMFDIALVVREYVRLYESLAGC